MTSRPWCLFLLCGVSFSLQAEGLKVDLSAIPSPILFRGDATTAYRDPAIVYDNGRFYLYYEVIKIEADKKVFIYTAWSKSSDLAHWTEPKIFTPRDQSLNYGSPGGVTRFGDDWILCLQTYPRPNGDRYGNKDSRIWIMRSKDLENWGPAELLAVLGPNVPQGRMGRMIDPFLIEDRAEPGKWWCFFKQSGQVHLSWSRDLKTWNTTPITVANGENPGAIVDGSEYVLCYAPANGIGIKRSSDLKEWRDEGILYLGQKEWPWTQGRLTAGFILDLRKNPQLGEAIMVFHGSQYPEADPRGGFDNFASIGIAWSSDLKNWEWPGKGPAKP